jgi:hypothetical protein
MMAPFSWPSGSALKDAAKEAGFSEIRLLTPTLPMVLEGGIDQAIRSFSATPVSPGVAALSQDVQKAFFARVRREMAPLDLGADIAERMRHVRNVPSPEVS